MFAVSKMIFRHRIFLFDFIYIGAYILNALFTRPAAWKFMIPFAVKMVGYERSRGGGTRGAQSG